jgi:hypothetical protein
MAPQPASFQLGSWRSNRIYVAFYVLGLALLICHPADLAQKVKTDDALRLSESQSVCGTLGANWQADNCENLVLARTGGASSLMFLGAPGCASWIRPPAWRVLAHGLRDASPAKN